MSDVDVGTLAELLHETADHHDAFEKSTPPHDWWDWYAAYMDARARGSTPQAASAAAGRYMEEVKHVVVSPARGRQNVHNTKNFLFVKKRDSESVRDAQTGSA